MLTRTTAVVALAAAGSFANAAAVLATFGYTDLDGSFDSGSSVFTARAISTGDFQTNGDVTSFFGGGAAGTAGFDAGFFGLSDADVTIELEVSNITATSADANGTVTIMDTNGDTLSASIQGTWEVSGPQGFMFFSGASSDFVFTDHGSPDAAFDGTSGSFDILNTAGTLFNGTVSILLANPGGFGGDFDAASTQADGILVPTPPVLVVAALGAFCATRRRAR